MGIQVIKNFFNDKELKIIKFEIEEAYKNNIHKLSGKNKLEWALGVDGGKVPLSTYPLHPIIDEEVYNLIKNKVESIFNLSIDNIGFHYGAPGSHMGWHIENGAYTGALSIYLNIIWDRNDGGYFCYEDDDHQFKLEIPEFNKAVFQQAGTPHCTTPVYDGAKIRKSIQVFFK
jgi:hypothetical protein